MSERIKKLKTQQIKHFASFYDLKILEYEETLEIQKRIVLSKIKNRKTKDQILFVEHPLVFTLGKQGGKENLSVSEEFLNSKNIKIIKTNRGGNITCHCPGQAVLYPIIDLKKHKIAVKDFVFGLEEVMRLIAIDYSINAERNNKNHGIWIKNAKIGSIGISIKHGISFHGLSMNINPDLKFFSWINPCGLKEISITSLENEIIKSKHKSNYKKPLISMQEIKKKFIEYFSSVFDYNIIYY